MLEFYFCLFKVKFLNGNLKKGIFGRGILSLLCFLWNVSVMKDVYGCKFINKRKNELGIVFIYLIVFFLVLMYFLD